MSKKPSLILLVAWLAPLFPTRRASAQIPDRAPDELIRFLTDESRRPETETLGLGGCGIDQKGREDRQAVALLVSQGDEAARRVESFLGSLDNITGDATPNLPLLLRAYARIEGPGAFPLLWRLHSSANIHDLDLPLDKSIALSFGLTSYVSNSQEPEVMILCREQQPRDALDQLVRSWQRGNREWLESTLGPNARASLTIALRNKTWSETRAEAWPSRIDRLTAVGYRFVINNLWSEPEWALRDYHDPSALHPELTTKFTSRSGKDCGERKVSFIHVSELGAPAYLAYLVDNANIVDILRLIGFCASDR